MRDYESGEFRHELKFLCSESRLALIGGRVGGLLKLDSHAAEGGYNIRSLYFDDYGNRCYYENENGVDIREKFRIRIYNKSAERIQLELKRKVHGKTQKLACPLTREQCDVLASGRPLPERGDDPPLLRKLCAENRTRLLKPKVIVEYERTPYVYPDGNVRITFDRHIMASTKISRFFDDALPKIPVLDTGLHILEIKYDRYLPGFLRQYLQLDSLRQTTFSKYCISRKIAL